MASKKKVSKKKVSKKKVSKKKVSKKKASKKKASKKKASKKKVSKKKASKKKVSKKKASKKKASRGSNGVSVSATKGGTDAAVNTTATGRSRSPRATIDGETVPEFALPDQHGETVSASNLLGEPFVLYFYPKDDTPGCTKEACGFRDEMAEFKEAGVRIVGVSPDKPERHVKFREKYGLDFTLLSDAEKVLSKELGVWKLKKNYGREYMGIERSTFLVDADGVVRKAWRAVRVAGHVPEVLAAARSL